MLPIAPTTTTAAVAAALLLTVPAAQAAPGDPVRTARLTTSHAASAPTTPSGVQGHVRLVLHPAEGTVCWRIRIEGMTTRSVHVHRRATGELLTRLYDEAPTDDDVLRGCTTDEPADLLRAYRDHPRRFHVRASSYDGQQAVAGTLRRPR